MVHPAFIPETCEEDDCAAQAVHTLVDDDGRIVGWYCEAHAEQRLERSNGELHYRFS